MQYYAWEYKHNPGSYSEFPFLVKSVVMGGSNCTLRETFQVKSGDTTLGTAGHIHTWVYLTEHLRTKLQEKQLLHSDKEDPSGLLV